MKHTIYIIRDQQAESAYYYDDLGYFEGIDSSDWKSVEFDTESEAGNYIAGMYHGCDERSPAGFLVLRSDMECDKPFIDALIK